MNLFITIVSFVLVLGVLVFFHELGHYWVARRSGIVVEEFGLGYPPRAIKLFRYDNTDFTLNWLPFGGFARMKGEDMGDMAPGSFNAASAGGRALTLLAGPLMNMILAAVLFSLSFMVGGSEIITAFPRVVETPSAAATALGLQPRDILLEAGGKAAHVNAIPEQRSTFSWQAGAQPAVDLVVLRNEARVTLGAAKPDAVTAFLGSPDYIPVLYTRIDRSVEGSPAAQAGLHAGDLVLSVNDETVSLDAPLSEVVRTHAGEEISMDVLRQGELLTLQMTPRANPPAGQGALGVQISLATEFVRMGVVDAVREGVLNTGFYILEVLRLPGRVFSGEVSPDAAQVSGPVGIAREVGGAVTSSIDFGVWWPILRLSAVLSAALAITNLLPLPALDGGRLLFIIIEKLRGRRINPEREGFVHMVGFMLLLSLLVFITIRDIATPHPTIDWKVILGQ